MLIFWGASGRTDTRFPAQCQVGGTWHFLQGNLTEGGARGREPLNLPFTLKFHDLHRGPQALPTAQPPQPCPVLQDKSQPSTHSAC